MDTAIQVQNLNQAVRISHRINNLEKGMNPTVLLSGMGK